MLAREVGPKVFNKKPIVVSHHMLLGLSAPQESYTDIEEKIMDLKMSKSNPEAAIFMTDTEKQIKQKIRKAFCPETADNNPILEYARYFIFEKMSIFKIERPSKFGGDIEFPNYNDLEDAYLKKEVHPADLKNGVARCINELVDPVRKEFESNAKLRDLRDQVLSFTVTR
jgi:tyrosyl-tRNA synthetase